MRAMLRLANLKWRMDARARWFGGSVSVGWLRTVQHMQPLRYAMQAAPVEPLPDDGIVKSGMRYLTGSTGPSLFVPNRSPLWRRALRVPGVFLRHYHRLRDLNQSRWQAGVSAGRMTLLMLR